MLGPKQPWMGQTRKERSEKQRHNLANVKCGGMLRNLYLVLAEQWEVKKNFKRFGISGHHNQISDASVQGLGGFVSTFLQLLVILSLLNKVKNCYGQFRIGKRIGFWVDTHFNLVW